MAWGVYHAADGSAHVIPEADLKPHVESDCCWCDPYDDDGVVVHNSMDRREEYERGRKAS